MKQLLGLLVIGLALVVADLRADTPATSPAEPTVTRVYDVAHIVVFAGVDIASGSTTRPAADAARELCGDLCSFIKEKVAPKSWEGPAGGKGVIRISAVSLQLVVRQTPEVHRQVEALLQSFRHDGAIQVCVDTSFVQVKKSVLEDIGISLASWEEAQPAPATLPASGPAKVSQAVAGQYLKEPQVQFLMDKIKHGGGRTLAAPSIMLINGGEGMLRQMDTQRYVGSVTPTTRPSGEVLYASKQEQAEDGMSLQVRANVSTDHRFVTLYLRPLVSRVLNMEQFTFSSPKPGPPVITIQQPTEQHIEVDTVVSVPDGDWLLLGGQVMAERGNKNPADGEEVLLILVRPRIVEGK